MRVNVGDIARWREDGYVREGRVFAILPGSPRRAIGLAVIGWKSPGLVCHLAYVELARLEPSEQR